MEASVRVPQLKEICPLEQLSYLPASGMFIFQNPNTPNSSTMSFITQYDFMSTNDLPINLGLEIVSHCQSWLEAVNSFSIDHFRSGHYHKPNTFPVKPIKVPIREIPWQYEGLHASPFPQKVFPMTFYKPGVNNHVGSYKSTNNPTPFSHSLISASQYGAPAKYFGSQISTQALEIGNIASSQISQSIVCPNMHRFGRKDFLNEQSESLKGK